MEGLNKNEVIKKDENTQEEIDRINKYFERKRKEKIERGEEIDERKINVEYENMKKFFRETREQEEKYREEDKRRFKGLNKEQILEHSDQKTPHIDLFTEDYIKAIIDSSIFEKNKERLIAYFLLKNKLKNTILVDLGCGCPDNTKFAYEFATAFEVKKYVGVEKYAYNYDNDDGQKSDGEGFKEKDYNDNIKNIQNNDIIKKLLKKNSSHELPNYEFALDRDMLGFLLERTEQSNFLISGIDDTILRPTSGENYKNYINELESQISRLTPEGGIVIINRSFINLEKFGFKKSYLEKKGNEKMVVWEKLKNIN